MSDTSNLGKRMRALRGEARLVAIGEVVSQWRTSGRSQAAFCRDVGIATVTLGRWLRQLEANRKPPAKSPVFVELGVADAADQDGYEVVLPGGTRLRVRHPILPDHHAAGSSGLDSGWRRAGRSFDETPARGT